jgi:hypothetical protein
VVEVERGKIRRADIRGDLSTPEDVLLSLLNAMRRPMPGSGGRYRPERIVLDDSALVEALAPSLAQIGVRCDYQPTLPLVEDAFRSMAAGMHKRELIPGLLQVPGVTVPMVEELFVAAVDYYRQTMPWYWAAAERPLACRFTNLSTIYTRSIPGSARKRPQRRLCGSA